MFLVYLFLIYKNHVYRILLIISVAKGNLLDNVH